MIRQDWILSKVKNLMNEYLADMLIEADKPRRKFLRQTLGAILTSGSLIVSEFGRWIHDDCSDIFYRIKRLLNHLVSPKAQMDRIVLAYRKAMAGHIQPDTPIIIDLTDLAKPRARKMEYLGLVRDGSEGKLVPGYWCVEVYAYLKGKKLLPLALDVFSVDDPAVGSQNLQITRTVRAVNEALEDKGIWIADRGFDGLNMYEMWFSLKCHFVVRQRGDRCIEVENGSKVIMADFVERLYQHQAEDGQLSHVVFFPVRLPEHKQQLYLVARYRAGYDHPLILLTNLVVQTADQARMILSYYRQRWSCEEAGRFLKSRVGFENFRIRRYVAIQRLAILAMLSMGFLSWILLRNKVVVNNLFSYTSRFRKKSKFCYYRLLDSLQEFVRINLLQPQKILFYP
jgi:hypothetical protein